MKISFAHAFGRYDPNAMTVVESILRDLNERLNPVLVDVARYVHSLNPKSKARRLTALLATAGCMSSDEGDSFIGKKLCFAPFPALSNSASFQIPTPLGKLIKNAL